MSQEEKEYFCEFPKWLRLTVLPWFIWLLIIVGVVFATKAYAAVTMIVKVPDGDFVRLLDVPCEAPEVVALVNPHILPKLKRADMRFRGKDYKACWTTFHDGMQDVVVVIDETNDVTPIPLKVFQPEGV